MNRNLVEYNDNYGASIDESGNITMITKDKTDYKFEEILKKENDLELLNDDMSVASTQYNDNKEKLKFSRIVNIFSIVSSIGMGILLYGIPLNKILISCLFLMGFIKLMSIPMYGTTIGNRKRIKKLKNKLSKLINKASKLEKEITDIKEKVNYTTLSDDSKKNNYQELSFDNNYTQNEEKSIGKVRVLKLR